MRDEIIYHINTKYIYMFLTKMEPILKRSRSLNYYELIKQLGQGSFGKVYLAVNPENRRIALKVIDIPEDKPYLLEQIRNELLYLKRLSQPQCNPHVICYYDSYEDKQRKQFLIEMEYIDGLELDQYITRLRQTQPPEVIYYYLLLIARAVTDGLNYSHRKGIVHNDIKPSNIMIDSNNVPRVVDFGLACSSISNKGRYCLSSGGSPNFVAPEFITQYTIRYPASDMWALGVTLYYLATGQYPFDFSMTKTFNDIFAIINNNEPRRLNSTNQQLNNLVNGLLVRDKNRRLTGDQVMDILNIIPQPVVAPVLQENMAAVRDRLGSRSMDSIPRPMDISINSIPQPVVAPVLQENMAVVRDRLGSRSMDSIPRPMDISINSIPRPMDIYGKPVNHPMDIYGNLGSRSTNRSGTSHQSRQKWSSMDKKSMIMSLMF